MVGQFQHRQAAAPAADTRESFLIEVDLVILVDAQHPDQLGRVLPLQPVAQVVAHPDRENFALDQHLFARPVQLQQDVVHLVMDGLDVLQDQPAGGDLKPQQGVFAHDRFDEIADDLVGDLAVQTDVRQIIDEDLLVAVEQFDQLFHDLDLLERVLDDDQVVDRVDMDDRGGRLDFGEAVGDLLGAGVADLEDAGEKLRVVFVDDALDERHPVGHLGDDQLVGALVGGDRADLAIDHRFEHRRQLARVDVFQIEDAADDLPGLHLLDVGLLVHDLVAAVGELDPAPAAFLRDRFEDLLDRRVAHRQREGLALGLPASLDPHPRFFADFVEHVVDWLVADDERRPRAGRRRHRDRFAFIERHPAALEDIDGRARRRAGFIQNLGGLVRANPDLRRGGRGRRRRRRFRLRFPFGRLRRRHAGQQQRQPPAEESGGGARQPAPGAAAPRTGDDARCTIQLKRQRRRSLPWADRLWHQ